MPPTPPSDVQKLEPMCTPPPAPGSERATTVWSPRVITNYDVSASDEDVEE